MIRIKIPNTKQISGAEVRKILGRNPRFMAISGGYLELPDDTTQTDIDKINAMLYSEEATFKVMLPNQQVEFLAKKLGVII